MCFRELLKFINMYTQDPLRYVYAILFLYVGETYSNESYVYKNCVVYITLHRYHLCMLSSLPNTLQFFFFYQNKHTFKKQ